MSRAGRRYLWLGVASALVLSGGAFVVVLAPGLLGRAEGPRRLSPEAISACTAELTSRDPSLRRHGCDGLIEAAQDCPAVADLLAEAVAALLDDPDMAARAQAIEGLGRLGVAARPFRGRIAASRGHGNPDLDDVVDAAVARIEAATPETADSGAYCSLLSRGDVEAAIRRPVSLGWDYYDAEYRGCTAARRRGF